MNKLLEILADNARLTNKEIAVMLGKSEKEVAKDIKLLEDTGVLKGYKAIINKDKAEVETVTAFIEIKVQPKHDHGFNDVANKIAQLEEVESIYLMSGGFDFAVMVNDKSFQEVAMFVANRLSPLEGVISTATHFILKRYKDQGVVFADDFKDDRGIVSLC